MAKQPDDHFYTQDFGGVKPDSIPTYAYDADGKTITIYYTTRPSHIAEEDKAGCTDFHVLNPHNPTEKTAIEAFRYQLQNLEQRYQFRFIDITGTDPATLPASSNIWTLWGADLSQFQREDGQKGAAGYPAYNAKTGIWSLVFDPAVHYSEDEIYTTYAHEIGHMLGEKHPEDEWLQLDPALDNALYTTMSNKRPDIVTIDNFKGYSVIAGDITIPPAKTFRCLDYEFLDSEYPLRPEYQSEPMKSCKEEVLQQLLANKNATLELVDGPGNQSIEGGVGENRYYDHQGDDIYLIRGGTNSFNFYAGGGTNTIRGLDTLGAIKPAIILGMTLSDDRMEWVTRDKVRDPHFYYEGEVPVLTFSGKKGICNIRLEEFSGNLSEIEVWHENKLIHPRIIAPDPTQQNSTRQAQPLLPEASLPISKTVELQHLQLQEAADAQRYDKPRLLPTPDAPQKRELE